MEKFSEAFSGIRSSLEKFRNVLKSALILAVLIAFSRLYLYIHYPTDILGGSDHDDVAE